VKGAVPFKVLLDCVLKKKSGRNGGNGDSQPPEINAVQRMICTDKIGILKKCKYICNVKEEPDSVGVLRVAEQVN
jgi:hypothetical protein